MLRKQQQTILSHPPNESVATASQQWIDRSVGLSNSIEEGVKITSPHVWPPDREKQELERKLLLSSFRVSWPAGRENKAIIARPTDRPADR